ncbi:MAG: DUF3987 domain-containing protein, partial [Betaproteobacteria bacterium]|nr:DUF3987 domain-containing protein [Betaproteobacteria bacterium]
MPLTRDLPPASPFPEAAMGTIGSEAVALMQRIIQAPSALVGQSVLAAINQVSQPYGNVCIDGRVSPLSEYFLTLGESGERKSAVDGWALAGVREHQKSLMAQYEQDRDAFEKALEVYETTSRRILADKKLSPEAKQARLHELQKPKAPVMPLLIVSEPSSEAIQRQLIIGEPSIGLVNDEGGQFLGGFAMSSEKRLGTLTTLSRLWDRGEFDRVRVTVPIQITRRARRAHIEVPASVAHHRANPPKPLTPLQAALVRGHRWLAMLESGKYPSLRALAEHKGIDNSYVSRMLNLTTLAPDIVEAILDESLPEHITQFDLASGTP